jgi:hypothetical protein
LLCSDAEVLSMFAMIINRLRGKMEAEVPRIFGAVFECTLQMITRNFEVRAVFVGRTREFVGRHARSGQKKASARQASSARAASAPAQAAHAAATLCYFPKRRPFVLPAPALHPIQDYPEHRLQFFSLLRAITNHCSATLFAMSQVGQPLSLRRPLPCSPPRMSPQLLPCCNCSLQAGCPLHPPSSLVPSCAFSSLTLSDTSLDSPLPWRRRPS